LIISNTQINKQIIPNREFREAPTRASKETSIQLKELKEKKEDSHTV